MGRFPDKGDFGEDFQDGRKSIECPTPQVNELKSPSRSPNDRSVYYDAVAEHSGGGGGGGAKGFATSGGPARSLGSFRESKNVEGVEAARKAAAGGDVSKATSGTSGGDSSESYNSSGGAGRQQHHRHYRHHR